MNERGGEDLVEELPLRAKKFIRRIPFLVFSGILIGYIILFPPPEIVFL